MLTFLIGRKYAAKHKEIFNCEALKAERTLKNIWRDVDTILFRVASWFVREYRGVFARRIDERYPA